VNSVACDCGPDSWNSLPPALAEQIVTLASTDTWRTEKRDYEERTEYFESTGAVLWAVSEQNFHTLC